MSMVQPPPVQEFDLFRSVYHHPDFTVITEGHYQRCAWPTGTPYWVLKEWRLWCSNTTVGEWRKIHGNQTRDIGALKLLLDNPPRCDPYEEN